MAWPTNYAPVSNNTAPLLTGLSSATTSYGNAVSVPVAVDPNTGELLVQSSGSGGGGTSSSFGSAFPTTGTAIGATNGTDMEPLNVDSSGNLKVIVENSSLTVTGTFWQTTQPVSLASLPSLASGTNAIGTVGVTSLPSLPAGTNTIGAISNTSFTATQTSGANLHVDVDNFPTTQAVSLTSTTITGTVAVTESGTWNVGLSTGTNNIGNVGTVLGGVNVGQTTSSTTAVQLNGGTSIAATNGIIVQALKANTATVYLGGSGVTTTSGFELQAGQAISFTCANINDLYVIGSNTTDKVCWSVL